MGLLGRTNPRATCWTVLRHGFVVGLVGALLYLVAMFWEGALREHWAIGLGVWTFLCALVGGLWEWQVRRDGGADGDV